MTISYRWLSTYLPQKLTPEQLSIILTSIGLEVESLEHYENFKGGLVGLLVGEVLEVEQHPNADKLKLTKVAVGKERPLNVVCGASNVAIGQKVVLAPVGATIFPKGKDPITMKLAKIRGEESEGMICAEDEIGISDDHAGIIVLDNQWKAGDLVAEVFDYDQDWIFEIGLTPNRMDAMSHYGVAKDVCAYLSYHETSVKAISPFTKKATKDKSIKVFKVSIEDEKGCRRYSGINIEGVTVKESPNWLKNNLKAIGVRSINNIVDITNYILHATGQPLHAFDADQIKDQKIIVKKYPAGTQFITLDGTARTLTAEDVMISDTEKPLCIAGVFGGLKSGVTATTKNIFLESAWFENVHIRKTSVHHGLRTDAATRFEKGVDITGAIDVLELAAAMIQELAGGNCSEVIDVYPNPAAKTKVKLSYAYLKKLSGKNYPAAAVKTILSSLGFEIVQETEAEIELAVPFHKPDISLPADLVEEILRIDGLDNIAIPTTISISPSIDPLEKKEKFKEKIANYLVGRGYTEIVTNSITNSAYFSEEVLAGSVKMLNNLTVELDLMRPSMLETGLEIIAYNLNRKNSHLSLFELGKVYGKSSNGSYYEAEQLAIYVSGKPFEDGWRAKGAVQDFFVAKGMVQAIFELLGIENYTFKTNGSVIELVVAKKVLGQLQTIPSKKLNAFGIKQAVAYVYFDLTLLMNVYQSKQVVYQEVSKYPSIERDLALVVPEATLYEAIESSIHAAKLTALKESRVFDIFESEKLGHQKKSVAINFVFNTPDKTLTDVEIDAMMQILIQQFEKNIQAEIRK
jgi:phenylalanyl-tRNA synthetase beta chain